MTFVDFIMLQMVIFQVSYLQSREQSTGDKILDLCPFKNLKTGQRWCFGMELMLSNTLA